MMHHSWEMKNTREYTFCCLNSFWIWQPLLKKSQVQAREKKSAKLSFEISLGVRLYFCGQFRSWSPHCCYHLWISSKYEIRFNNWVWTLNCKKKTFLIQCYVINRNIKAEAISSTEIRCDYSKIGFIGKINTQSEPVHVWTSYVCECNVYTFLLTLFFTLTF